MDEVDGAGTSGRDINREMQSKLLQEELGRRGWNQSDLARATKLPRYTISRIVRGRVLMSEDTAHRVALALDLDPGALVNLSRRSATAELVDGFQATSLPDGMVRLRVNTVVQPGIQTAVESLLAYDRPLRPRRLAHLLNALFDELPAPKGD